MADSFPYRELYDRLRRAGYHEHEDKTSHLAPYVPWLKERLAYQSVLDIGCSTGGSFPLIGLEGQEVWGVDVSTVAVERARALRRNVVQASATDLPFPDDRFDLVVSADVFEHLHEDDAADAAREAIRVARKYVFMKIASQVDATEKWKAIAGHPLHLTTRPLAWWKQFFAGAGTFIRSEEHVFCLELYNQPRQADDSVT